MYYCFNIQATKPRQISDGVGGEGGTAKKDNIKMLYVCVNEENLE